VTIALQLMKKTQLKEAAPELTMLQLQEAIPQACDDRGETNIHRIMIWQRHQDYDNANHMCNLEGCRCPTGSALGRSHRRHLQDEMQVNKRSPWQEE
jgi:hypothetical protein